MSFLTLNGVQVKVLSATPVATYTELGEFSRSLAGQMRKEVRATKRAWKMELRPVNPDAGHALVQMLMGRGHGFPFDTDKKSAGGITPTTDTNTVLNTATDGSPLYCSKVSNALSVGSTTTNLWDVNVRRGTGALGNTTGFTAVDGATIASNSTHRVADASLSVVTSAVVNGVRGGAQVNSTAGFSAGSTYAGSVWVKPTTSTSIRAYLRDETAGVDGTPVTVACAANVWTRIDDFTITMGGASTNASMYVLEETADSGITFYCDHFQVEVGTVSDPWADPTTATAASLTYTSGPVAGWRDMTINAWVTLSTQVGTACYYLRMNSGAVARLYLNNNATNGELAFASYGRLGVEDKITATGLSRRTLYMVTCVVRRNPRSGQAKKELWVNGSMISSSSPAEDNMPDFDEDGTIDVGHGGATGTELRSGTIDELQILPYAADSTQIAAWYTATRSLCTQPQLVMTGDLLKSWESVNVQAIVDKVENMPAYIGSTFYPNVKRISCTLEEV